MEAWAGKIFGCSSRGGVASMIFTRGSGSGVKEMLDIGSFFKNLCKSAVAFLFIFYCKSIG